MSPSLLTVAYFSTILATDGNVGRQLDWDFECGTSFPFTPSTVNLQCYIRISHRGGPTWSNTAAHVQCTDSKTFANTQANDGPIVRGEHAVVILPRVIFGITVPSVTRLRQRQYADYLTSFVIAQFESSPRHWNATVIAHLSHESTPVALVVFWITISICFPATGTVLFAG